MRRIRIRPVIAWYDLWVGIFIDRDRRKAYILPLPCIGISVEWRVAPEKSALSLVHATIPVPRSDHPDLWAILDADRSDEWQPWDGPPPGMGQEIARRLDHIAAQLDIDPPGPRETHAPLAKVPDWIEEDPDVSSLPWMIPRRDRH